MYASSIHNESGKHPITVLLELIGKALSSRYRVLIDLPMPDYVGGRRERTRAMRSVEAELFGDGSGIELAFWGLRCMCGVEEKFSFSSL